jgi:hypothetical protein
MSASAEFLWRLNQEYVNRLTKARNYLDLLGQLVLERGGQTEQQLLSTLEFTQTQFDQLSDEHRGWRHAYFYESTDSKRVVQKPRAVQTALAQFGEMHDRHRAYLDQVLVLFYRLPRPDTCITSVPNGDLWELMQLALGELVDFSNDLNVADLA